MDRADRLLADPYRQAPALAGEEVAQESGLPAIDGQLPPGLDRNPRSNVIAPVIGIGRHPLRRVTGAFGLVYGGRNGSEAVEVVGEGPPATGPPRMSTRVPCFLQWHDMVNV